MSIILNGTIIIGIIYAICSVLIPFIAPRSKLSQLFEDDLEVDWQLSGGEIIVWKTRPKINPNVNLHITITVQDCMDNKISSAKPKALKYHEPVFDDMTCREPSYDGGYGHEPDFNIDSFDAVNDTAEMNYVDPEPSYDSNDGHEPSYD